MAYSHTPTYIGKGAFQSGLADLTVPVPTGIRNDDMLIIIVESANQNAAAPTGWTEFTNSPQSTGTAAAIGGVRLNAFYKIVYGAEASVTIADTGNHTTAIMFAVRGVDPADPIDLTAGRVDASATASMSWQTLTTSNNNEMILMLTALDQDAAGTAQVGTVTAASLTGKADIHDQTMTSGVGGGIYAGYGFKATAGSIGTMTATGAASTTHAYLTVALNGRSDAIVVPRGQYLNDYDTPVSIGSNVPTANDGIVLVSDVSPVWEFDTTFTANAEVVTTATNFTNVYATITEGPLEPQSSDTNHSTRGGSMVYDEKNDRYVMFGGYDGTTRYNNVWAKDMTVPGQPWRMLTISGTAPAGKNLATASYFRGNKTTGGADTSIMLIWGGTGAADTNELHVLNLTTVGSETWTTVTQTSAPSARSYLGRISVATPVSGDSSQCYFYLFGGWATNRENGLYRCTIDLDSMTTTTWTTLKATGAAGNPTIRSGAILDYKESANKLYLYGGASGTAYLNDFWSYDIAGNTWTQETVTGTAPTGTEFPAGGYDVVNNRFWYSGGWTGTQATGRNNIGYINDVGGSESYVEVRPFDADNQAYAGHSSSANWIDTKRNWIVMYTQMMVDNTDRYSYIIDLNESSSPIQTVYGMNDGDWMGARDAPASVWNSDRSEFLVISGFGQMADETSFAQGTHLSEVWAYDSTNNRWRYVLKGHKTMPHTEGTTAVYDTTRGRIVVFGGLSGVSYNLNEAWTLTADENGMYEWAKLNPTGTAPTARWLCASAFDATNNRMVIAMGGSGTTIAPTTSIYELSFASSADGVWTERTPTGTATGVWGPGYAYKSSNNRLYIFGGATNAALSTVSSQLVYLDLSSTTPAWTTPTSSSGTGRRTPAFGYDATNDRLAVFGGYNGSASIQTLQYWSVASGGAWTTTQPAPQLIDARRSSGHMFIGTKFYVTHGRSDSAMWYATTWELTPNYSIPDSSTWSNKMPRKFIPVYTYFDPDTSGDYHWQAWSTEQTVAHTKVSFGGNSDTVTAATDFTLGSTGPATYTRIHTTDSNKRKTGLALGHTTDAFIHGTSFYSREQNNSLPTDAAARSTLFAGSEYATVSSDNSTYIDQAGVNYLLFQFERTNGNNTDNITASWNGKTTLAPTSKTVYLQIYNTTTLTWSTLDSSSVASANTDFTLTGSITSSPVNYYDGNNRVQFRVYQGNT